METSFREETVSLEREKSPEQERPKAEISPKEAVTPRNKEVDRIWALIQEGKLSSHRASFYRKLPSAKENLNEQERKQ